MNRLLNRVICVYTENEWWPSFVTKRMKDGSCELRSVRTDVSSDQLYFFGRSYRCTLGRDYSSEVHCTSSLVLLARDFDSATKLSFPYCDLRSVMGDNPEVPLFMPQKSKRRFYRLKSFHSSAFKRSLARALSAEGLSLSEQIRLSCAQMRSSSWSLEKLLGLQSTVIPVVNLPTYEKATVIAALPFWVSSHKGNLLKVQRLKFSVSGQVELFGSTFPENDAVLLKFGTESEFLRFFHTEWVDRNKLCMSAHATMLDFEDESKSPSTVSAAAALSSLSKVWKSGRRHRQTTLMRTQAKKRKSFVLCSCKSEEELGGFHCRLHKKMRV